jgi:hypothetical protein
MSIDFSATAMPSLSADVPASTIWDNMEEDGLSDDGLSGLDTPVAFSSDLFPEREGPETGHDGIQFGESSSTKSFRTWKVDHTTGNYRLGG